MFILIPSSTMQKRIPTSFLLGAILIALPSFAQGQYIQPVAHFVPDASRRVQASLELRSEATIYGSEIRLKQIARWSETDNAAMSTLADLTITRLEANDDAAFKTITMETVKQTLTGAGLNLAELRFTGSTSCRVTRSDKHFDEPDALDQWLTGRTGPKKAPEPKFEPLPIAQEPVARQQAPTIDTILPQAHDTVVSPTTLKGKLIHDLATRMGLDEKDLQLTFGPDDDRLLNLSEPQFRFGIEPRRARALGMVTWEVTISTNQGAGQHKATLTGNARAWQNQVVVDKPITMKGVIRAEDVVSRRVLVEQISGETLLSIDQIVGQQASRNLPAGTLVTSRAVEAVPLVRAGQLVTVTLGQGAVQIKTVARAAEAGTFGQTIKVKNETTKDIYDVVLTGPQQGVVGGEGIAMAR